ncbi:hypothetical protein SDC9_61931 [bioreactor metagenome]|uniref:ABC-2 transporter permease n=1 Tax=bioreactor metagenome TaxID=1076179 RepID=A0A644XH69_9ZZZZ
MNGMVRKELYLFKVIGKSYLLVLGIFIILTLTGLYQASFAGSMIVLLLTMAPVTTCSYDELAGWDKFAAATPAGRAGIVKGKYIFALIMAALSLVLILAVNGALILLGRGDSEIGTLPQTVGLISFGLLILSILLPLTFRFGAQKSRVLMILVMAALVSAVGAMLVVGGKVSGLNLSSLLLFVPVPAAVAMAISYVISKRIYNKKDL